RADLRSAMPPRQRRGDAGRAAARPRARARASKRDRADLRSAVPRSQLGQPADRAADRAAADPGRRAQARLRGRVGRRRRARARAARPRAARWSDRPPSSRVAVSEPSLPTELRLALDWELWVIEQLLFDAKLDSLVTTLVEQGVAPELARSRVLDIRRS